MKSKPIVMEHFSTVHTSFVLDFKFTSNITILTEIPERGRPHPFLLSQLLFPVMLHTYYPPCFSEGKMSACFCRQRIYPPCFAKQNPNSCEERI